MNTLKYFLIVMALGVWILGSLVNPALGQAECTAWGNLTGIRVDGQLMEFETSLRVVAPDWSRFTQTAKERQLPRFSRDGNKQTISSRLENLSLVEMVEDTGPGSATVNVQFTAEADTNIAGAFFCISLPGGDYSGGTVELIDPAPPARKRVSFTATWPNGQNEYVRATASGARFVSPRRQLEVTFSAPTEIIVRDDRRRGNTDIQVYLAVISGNAKKGQTAQKTFTLKATGEIDKEPIELTLDPSRPGRAFDGIGGNFRLQNPKTDPQVIDYCLENLRVAWGRVEMPWRFWHPEEDVDPIEAANAGQLNPRVQAAMEMAQRLSQMGMPVILADWSGPDWAIQGSFSFRPQPGGLRGNPLDPAKMDQIYASIAAYVIYLKENYGVEAAAFSFNESDLGIYVRQTDEEHTELIKGLGAYFASKGLKTRLLLGDTADANGYRFIYHAMADPDTPPYILAVSFHSWRGWSDETLNKWADAAEQLAIPLIVGEGSIDAAAWRYPAIFEEPVYALEEINLYTRILAICQPLSILQWQLTADYSVMAGGGIFGNEGPLQPTQRFWNLKQLGSTPAGTFAMPITGDRPAVTCAALGDNARGVYALHIVNNGATRQATLTGLPDNVKELRIYVTDTRRGMDEGERVPVSNGRAQFTLDATSFTSLFSIQ